MVVAAVVVKEVASVRAAARAAEGWGVGEGEGGGSEGGGSAGGGGGGRWALCAEDRRTGEYFPRSRALSSRICDGTVLRTMSSMLSTPTASSMDAWSLSRGPRWRAANLSLAASVAAADDMCRGAPILPISARIAGWAKPLPSCKLRILSRRVRSSSATNGALVIDAWHL